MVQEKVGFQENTTMSRQFQVYLNNSLTHKPEYPAIRDNLSYDNDLLSWNWHCGSDTKNWIIETIVSCDIKLEYWDHCVMWHKTERLRPMCHVTQNWKIETINVSCDIKLEDWDHCVMWHKTGILRPLCHVT